MFTDSSALNFVDASANTAGVTIAAITGAAAVTFNGSDAGTAGSLFVDLNSDGDFTYDDDMVIGLVGVTTMDITGIQFG
ncbi:MAG: hypothetical protein DRR42_19725 [Gammaproteobacteria bacterium]|nr:MAG: hypothetical protein DRR42_19725 [Gammaproteobacteria bacterium]